MPVNGWQALIPNMVQLPPVSAAGYSLAGTGLGTPSARTCYLVFLRPGYTRHLVSPSWAPTLRTKGIHFIPFYLLLLIQYISFLA